LKPKSYSTIAKIIPQQQPSLKSSTQSSKINTNNSTEEEEDDDGGVNLKKIIKQKQKAEEKKIRKDDLKKKKQLNIIEDSVDEDEDGGISKQKYKIKKIKTNKKSMFTKCFQDQDEDEDGGVSKQKILAIEKKKKITEDNDDDDDDVPKQKELIKKKISNKSNISKKEDADECVVKTDDNIKMRSLSKQPIPNKPRAKDESSSDNTDDCTIQSSKQPKSATSTSVDTIDRKASKISVNNRNTKLKKPTDKYHYNTVPTEEEPIVRVTTTNSSPLKSQKSFSNKLYFLRTISYCEAQQRSPPTVSQRQKINSSLLSNQNNTNDHDNQYSEIRNDTIPSSINNRLYSIIKLILSLSTHSHEQQILTEIDHNKAENEKKRKRRRKIARTRWYLAYTLIHNPWLSNLREKVLKEKSRLPCSRQSSQLNQQVLTSVTTDQESVATTTGIKSETLRMRRMK